ncbi:MAG: HNH endonuclease signature motif containing protein [Mesorhizobium sp.]
MSSRRDEIRNRLLANVVITDMGYETPCWLWTMADSGRGRGGGYGRIKLNGRTCAAHIVSYTNEHGYVPGNKQIDHLCRNRRCINPDHLEMISHGLNQKRRAMAATRANESEACNAN